ncbi:MAG: hypothetical protein AAGC85_08605 [Bacteroidota bacterium]
MNIVSSIILGLVSIFALTMTIGAIGNFPYFFTKEPIATVDKQHGRMVARLILIVIGGFLLILTVLMIVVVYSVL